MAKKKGGSVVVLGVVTRKRIYQEYLRRVRMGIKQFDALGYALNEAFLRGRLEECKAAVKAGRKA
jgi:hypothetical protein